MNKSLDVLCKRLEWADRVIVGASNGLSIAEGVHLFADNADFERFFGDFRRRYGFNSLIRGCFYPFPTSGEKWAYFARLYAYFWRNPPSRLLTDLYNLLKNKDFFVETSNIDGHFVQAGFPKAQLFEIEGNILNMQCIKQCRDHIYPAAEALKNMETAAQTGFVPSELQPHCPHCGGEMQIHIELDRNFQHAAEWRAQHEAYSSFLRQAEQGNTLLLELGVGARNQLIKQPFMQFAYQHGNSFYITINKGELFVPAAIAERSLGIDADLGALVGEWAKRAV